MGIELTNPYTFHNHGEEDMTPTSGILPLVPLSQLGLRTTCQ